MNCPKCGYNDCQIISETTTSGKDFHAGKGCCGAVLFGPTGLLCGLCGRGKRTTSRAFWICSQCGYKFKA